MYGYIYLITNRVNGKIYVGQHKYDKIELDPNYHGSGVKLQNAYNKHGIDKFDTTLIDTADTLEELNQKETFYIDVLDCRNPDVGYNIAEGGGIYNLFEGHKHTEESKQKISEARAGEKHPNYGKHHTEEHKQKLSEAQKKRWEDPEYRQKVSESQKIAQNRPEYKQKISENHADFSGSKNPRAKKHVYNGIGFGCIKDAWKYARDYCGYDKSLSTFRNQFKG